VQRRRCDERIVKNKEGEHGLTWSFSLGVETVFDPSQKTDGNIEETFRSQTISAPITSCFV
jgi:hypothetical protein